MSNFVRVYEAAGVRTDWWRLALIVAATLILCSCRGVSPPPATTHAEAPYPAGPMGLAETGAPGIHYAAGTGDIGAQPWAPPGLERPWPRDEYLRDGGDRNMAVRIRGGSVVGLDTEDTVAHFETIQGETLVEPSNRVAIYAPRFAAVRKVFGVSQYERHQRMIEFNAPAAPRSQRESRLADVMSQPTQAERQVGTRSSSAVREDQLIAAADNAQPVSEFDGRLLPYEDFQLIRSGVAAQTDKIKLAHQVQAARVWFHEQAVQVIIDGQAATIATGDKAAQTTYEYVLTPGRSRLRVVKLASTEHAKPGETVDFTIRFDNVGDEPVQNVTLVDHLTGRLGYVDGSAQSSRQADFSTHQGQDESLVLRWRIAGPLKPGEGGIVRFKCQVR